MIEFMAADPGPRVPDSIDEFRTLARARLNTFDRIAVPDDLAARRAAVALCVVDNGAGPAVIVIKRAYRGRNAGQWGLPGGRVERGETLERAAARELHEELGLVADPADVLGILDDFPDASGFAITPIVTTLSDIADLDPSADEVHSVHFVDLHSLAAEGTPHWVRRGDTDTPATPETGLLQMRLAPDMTIHAPTGAMLWQFREVVLLGRRSAAARVAHFLQPDWTHH